MDYHNRLRAIRKDGKFANLPILCYNMEKEGGIDQLIELFTGRQAASSSPVAQLASSIFSSDIAKKLGLSPAIVNAIVPMIPVVIEKFTSSEKIDINDLISEATASGVTDRLKDVADNFLGGLFK